MVCEWETDGAGEKVPDEESGISHHSASSSTYPKQLFQLSAGRGIEIIFPGILRIKKHFGSLAVFFLLLMVSLVELLKMWLCLSCAGCSRMKKAMSVLDASSSQRPGLTWEAETKWKNLYRGGRLQKQKLKPIWTILFSFSRLHSAPSPRRTCLRETPSISTRSFSFLPFILPATWAGATWG